MMLRGFKSAGVLLTGLCLFAIAGCGAKSKPTGKLQGSVTFDGSPVKDATVQIQSMKTGEAFAAKVDSTGKYAFSTPVTTGEYQVSVIPAFEPPVAGSVPPGSPQLKPPVRNDIPEQYRIPTKSPLKFEVKPGDNTFDAKLTK